MCFLLILNLTERSYFGTPALLLPVSWKWCFWCFLRLKSEIFVGKRVTSTRTSSLLKKCSWEQRKCLVLTDSIGSTLRWNVLQKDENGFWSVRFSVCQLKHIDLQKNLLLLDRIQLLLKITGNTPLMFQLVDVYGRLLCNHWFCCLPSLSELRWMRGFCWQE